MQESKEGDEKNPQQNKKLGGHQMEAIPKQNRYFWGPGGTWTADDHMNPEVLDLICK